MRKLNYIKLFEAFDSKIISRTLSYVKDKSELLNIIKKICISYDFPYSELKDDFFEYLPFNKAVRRVVSIEDEPCDAKSAYEFGDSGIEGEVCNSGKIKRMWGQRTRTVDCPKCNGTGIKVKKRGSQSVKLIKMWFDKSGEYIGITGVDGSKVTFDKMSTNIDDYEIGASIPKSRLKRLPTGTFIKVDYESRSYWDKDINDLICYVINNRGTYLIQNEIHNGAPWNVGAWQKIANKSLNIDSSTIQSVNNIKMLIPKNKPQEIHEVGLSTSYHGFEFNDRVDVQSLIKKAHFAIVLDVGELKDSDYKRASQISSERRDMRSGATKLKSDEQIKSENLERYLSQISKGIKLSEDSKNVKRYVKRIIGFRYVLLILLATDYESYLGRLTSLYYNFISNPNESNTQDLNYFVERTLERQSNKINVMVKNFNWPFKYKDGEIIDGVNIEKAKKLATALKKLSSFLYDKVSDSDIETIEDIEILDQKLRSVKEISNNSRHTISDLRRFLYYIDTGYNTPASVWEYVNYDKLDETIEGFDKIKKIINRIL